jgi:hypothetical protein
MTQWGALLLCAYLALGLGPTTWRKAVRLAVAVTTITLAAVMVQYGALH